MPKLKDNHIYVTEAEDKAITKAIAGDPDSPEWTQGEFKRAQTASSFFRARGLPVPSRRGRPKKDNPKTQISLRLDADIVNALRASGTGWQTKVNQILRHELKLG